MHNELSSMRTFVAVAELRSFTAAARTLGVGQSTVSRRVADLESDLEVALLSRTAREVRPTAAGARYYEAARAAVAAVDSARAAAQTEAKALDGTLRIGCSTLFGRTWLAPRLPDWLQSHPKLRLEIHSTNAHVDLVAHGLDLSLRLGGPPTSELRGRRIRTMSRHVLASREWVERHGHPASPSDLTDVRCLMFTGPEERRWVLHRGDERYSVRPDTTVVASSGGLLETLARNHVGPVLVPDWVADLQPGGGQLVRILPEWEGSALPLWVVWPGHTFQSAAARLFLQWIVDQHAAPR